MASFLNPFSVHLLPCKARAGAGIPGADNSPRSAVRAQVLLGKGLQAQGLAPEVSLPGMN